MIEKVIPGDRTITCLLLADDIDALAEEEEQRLWMKVRTKPVEGIMWC